MVERAEHAIAVQVQLAPIAHCQRRERGCVVGSQRVENLRLVGTVPVDRLRSDARFTAGASYL
jgi:hypothetical protein